MCSHVYDLVRGSTALSSCVLLEDNALTSFIARHNYHTTPAQEVYGHAKRDLHTMNNVVSLSFFDDSQIHAHTALCWAASAQGFLIVDKTSPPPLPPRINHVLDFAR